MKNLILIALVAVLSVCSCSSSYDKKVIDSWKVWVAGEKTNIIRSYWENNEKDVDVENLFPEGVRLENTKTKEITISDTYIKTAYYYCQRQLRFSYASAILSNKESVFPKEVVSDYLKDFGLCKHMDNHCSRSKDKDAAEWFIRDDESIAILTQACVQGVGTFEDICEYIHNAVSVYSFSLVERENQHKLYEVIYHIHYLHYGEEEYYALCNILIQNDGSSEIEIVKLSRNLLDLI